MLSQQLEIDPREPTIADDKSVKTRPRVVLFDISLCYDVCYGSFIYSLLPGSDLETQIGN